MTFFFSYFPALAKIKKTNVWTGIRPVSYDSLPIIGASPRWENLFYNAGHGGMGWLLATGSAQIIADAMIGKASYLPENFFSPKRWA